MKCELCGAENKSDSLTCSECGGALTPQNSESPKTEVKEEVNAQVSNGVAKSPKSNMGKIAVIGASLVAVLVVAFLLMNFKSSSNDVFANRTLRCGLDKDFVLGPYNGEMVEFKDNLVLDSYSLDRSVIAFTGEDDALHVYSNGAIEEVAKDVTAVRISLNGNRVAYTKKSEENFSELYVYDLKSKETTKITDKARLIFDGVSTNITISPNGNRVAYMSVEDSVMKGYVAVVGEEPEMFASEGFALALNDDGSYFYYAKIEEQRINIYLKTKETEMMLQKAPRTIEMFFNSDLTQVVFNDENGAFFSNKGEEKVNIHKDHLAVYNYNDLAESTDEYPQGFGTVSVTGFSDITKAIFLSEDNLYYLDDALVTQKIMGDTEFNFLVSKDAKSLLYSKNNKLFKMDDIAKSSSSKAYEIENVSNFIASPSFKEIYYTNDDSELFYFDGKTSTRVGDNVKEWTINKTSGVLYYISDNELFRVNKDKMEKIPTEGMIGKLYHYYNAVFYFAQADGMSWHRSIDDGEFEVLYKEK